MYTRELKKKTLQFSALQWLLWSTWCTYGPFNVLYLNAQGYSNTTIGWAVSVMTFMGIIGQYFWGYICDRTRTVKMVFIICMIGLAAVVVPYRFYSTPLAITVAMGIIGFMWNPASSIIDSWILGTSDELARNYGFMRAWGSIGFALLASVFGIGIERFGWNLMFVSFGILAALTVLVAFAIEDSYKAGTEKDRKSSVNPLELFKNTDYVLLLVVTLFLFIPANAVMIFLPVMLKNLGGTAAHQGLALFAVAVSEFPVLLLARRFVAKFNPQFLLLFAAVFYLLRVWLMLLAKSPAQLIYIGLLQSLTFAVFLPTVRYYVNQIAPEGLKTTAQTVITAVFFGAASILASLVGGLVIDRFGLDMLLRGCVTISALAVLLLLALVLRPKSGQRASEKSHPAAAARHGSSTVPEAAESAGEIL